MAFANKTVGFIGSGVMAEAMIKGLIDRAQQLEEQRLKANPNDVDALYARGSTRALPGRSH